MGRTGLMVAHFGLLFIAAWALRPDLAAAKDAINTHFSEVQDDSDHGNAWDAALNQKQGVSHLLGFYRNAAQDSAERYPSSPETVGWGDGVILRWAAARIDLNYHCDRPPPTPALGICASTADTANALLGATAGQWTPIVYPSSFPSQIVSVEFPIYIEGDTQEALMRQVDALTADIVMLTSLSPTVLIFAVMEDGYNPGQYFELVSETTSITGVWINSKTPPTFRTEIYSTSYGMLISETSMFVVAINFLCILIALVRLVDEVHDMQLAKKIHGSIWEGYVDFWNVVDIITISATLVSSVLILILSSMMASQMSTLTAEGFNFTISRYLVVTVTGTMITTLFMIAIITSLLVCVSIFKYFSDTHPGLALFSATLWRARRPLQDIILVVLYIIFFIAMVVWLIFSWMGGNAEFVTFWGTLVSIINLTLGFYDFSAFTGGREFAWTALVIFVTIIFVVCVFGLVIISQNIILAIISDAYSKVRDDLEPAIKTYPSYIHFLFQIVGFAVVASARLLSTCFCDWRKAGEAVIDRALVMAKKEFNGHNGHNKKLNVWRHGSVSMFPEMATLLVSCASAAGEFTVGGFAENLHDYDDDGDDEEELTKSSPELAAKENVKKQLLKAVYSKRGLKREELENLMKLVVEEYKVDTLKLLGFIPMHRFSWPKAGPEGDKQLTRFLDCIMKAYGRKMSGQRWEEMKDELSSDVGKSFSRSLRRPVNKQASSMIKAGWAGMEGHQDLQVADLEQQALPRAASRSD